METEGTFRRVPSLQKRKIRMKKILATLVIILAVTSHARIGWTKEQCDKKYGKSTELRGMTIYNVRGKTLLIMFVDNKCASIFYRGIDSQSVVEKLMELNGFPEDVPGTYVKVNAFMKISMDKEYMIEYNPFQQSLALARPNIVEEKAKEMIDNNVKKDVEGY